MRAEGGAGDWADVWHVAKELWAQRGRPALDRPPVGHVALPQPGPWVSALGKLPYGVQGPSLMRAR